jgi:hypothetical protein
MLIYMKARLFLCLIFAQFLFFSCSARISGSIAADGSAVFNINTSLQQRMTALIRNIAAAGGSADGGNVLDGPFIAESMSDSPGISSVQFKNTSPSAIEGSVRISKIGDFLAAGKLIVYEQNASGGKCQINISRENGPVVLELLSWEITMYLNALMAPIATGEAISKSEYLSLLSSVYSRGISEEIAASRIRATIDFPGTISAVKGGTFSAKRADFDIPLIDLLVLETPLSYEVQWR